MNGFRKFILRGNLVDLAVAVVIGTQFASLVKAFVASFIKPLLALFGGQPDFDKFKFTLRGKDFTYGLFVTEVISFLISAAVVYFLIVIPVARMLNLFDHDQPTASKNCPECTMSIPINARRCPECTTALPESTAEQPARTA